jgi:hypothetical protein
MKTKAAILIFFKRWIGRLYAIPHLIWWKVDILGCRVVGSNHVLNYINYVGTAYKKRAIYDLEKDQ